MTITIKLCLDTRRAKQDGTYPLIMRVLYNRRSIAIQTGYCLFESEWVQAGEKIKKTARLGENITRLNNLLHKQRTQAFDILNSLRDRGELEYLTLKEIKARIVGQPLGVSSMTVFAFIDSLIEEMIEAKRSGNARVYKTLRYKLKSFDKSEKLTFLQITYPFLKKLETKHYAMGGDTGGLSVYMRTLRAVYNKAIKAGITTKDGYPFDDYSIKNKKPVHKSMAEEEFNALLQYHPETGSPHHRAKSLFLASFYLRGMNWMDMAYLTSKNIISNSERINYTRKKTGEPFSIKITPPLQAILNYFNNPDSKYLFSIIPDHQPETQHSMTIRNKRQRLNKTLKEIAKYLNITPFTIYTARHTYATMAKRKGVPTAVIQESLGHATETMTQTYLNSFENTTIDHYDQLIMGE